VRLVIEDPTTRKAPAIRSLLLWTALASAIPLLVLLAIDLRTTAREERAKAEALTAGAVREMAARVDDYLDKAILALHLAARMVHLDPARRASNDSLLRVVKAELPSGVNNLALWSTSGENIGHSRSDASESQRRNVADRAYFQGALQSRRLAVGEPVVSRSTGAWTVALALPILRADSSVAAVLSLSTQVVRLQEMLAPPASLPDSAVISLVSGEGVVLARSLDPSRFVGLQRAAAPAVVRARAEGSGVGVFAGIDSVERLLAFTTLRHAPWHAFVGIPTSTAFAGARRAVWRAASSVAIAAGVALLIAFRLSSSIRDTLRTLAGQVSALGAGDLSRRAPLDGPRELRDLTRSVNRMAADIEVRQHALEATESRYRFLFEENVFPMWVQHDATLGILDVNRAAIAQYGYSRGEFMQLTARELGPTTAADDDAHPVSSAPVTHRRKDGTAFSAELTTRHFALEGEPVRLVLAIDVSARLRLEEHVRQADKMDSVGRLAGGIAHDFNNLLTAILAGVQFALDALPPDSPARSELQLIDAAGQRAADLTRQLLAFARKQPTNPRVVSLSTVVGGVEQLLRRVLGEQVELVVRAAPDTWDCHVDPGQVEQYIVNLAVNARDAMHGTGRLILEVDNVVLDEVMASRYGELAPGDYVRLSVADDGEGMTAEVMEHLFEPFFTTKEVGAGTGLGLATCYGIVKQNGGAVFVYSELGQGTTFKAYFPRSAGARTRATPAGGSAAPAEGHETLLLVEDDPMVRAVGLRSLSSAGFHCLEAPNAEAALELAARHAGPIDALVTDVVLPSMSGFDLARTLRRERPRLKVIYTSGWSEASVRYEPSPGEDFVQKPYVGVALTRSVRRLLDRG